MNGSECCGSPCRFWRRLPANDCVRNSDGEPLQFGQCRHRPPRFDGSLYHHECRYAGMSELTAYLNASAFPWTREGDWCGEFEPAGEGWTGVV